MELPTYTSIWRIEKRLYKLYDFRLPMPLPVGQIAVFAAVTVPYMVLLTLFGLPFNHNLFWLYVLPPGLLTWLATRPVLESKRLPELIISQARYIGEPSTWCRMAPLTEKDEIVVFGRVWRRVSVAPGVTAEQEGIEQRAPARELPVPARAALPVVTAAAQGVSGQAAAEQPVQGSVGAGRRGRQAKERQARERQAREEQVRERAPAGPAQGHRMREPGEAPGTRWSRRAAGTMRRQAASAPAVPTSPASEQAGPAWGQAVSARDVQRPPTADADWTRAAGPVADAAVRREPGAAAPPRAGRHAGLSRPAAAVGYPAEAGVRPSDPDATPGPAGEAGRGSGAGETGRGSGAGAVGYAGRVGDTGQAGNGDRPASRDRDAGVPGGAGLAGTVGYAAGANGRPAQDAGTVGHAVGTGSGPVTDAGSGNGTGGAGAAGYAVGAGARPRWPARDSGSGEDAGTGWPAGNGASNGVWPGSGSAQGAGQGPEPAAGTGWPAGYPPVTSVPPGTPAQVAGPADGARPARDAAPARTVGPAADSRTAADSGLAQDAALAQAAAPAADIRPARDAGSGCAVGPTVDSGPARDAASAPAAGPAADIGPARDAGLDGDKKPGPAREAGLDGDKMPGPARHGQDASPANAGPGTDTAVTDTARTDTAGIDGAEPEQAGPQRPPQPPAPVPPAPRPSAPRSLAPQPPSPVPSAPQPPAPVPPAPQPSAPPAVEPQPPAPVTIVPAQRSVAGPPPAAPARPRPAPVERALSGPGERRSAGWRGHVTVVPGGHGPGRPDHVKEARSRAVLSLDQPRLVVVLGCTVGAGQTVTALILADLLAGLRAEPVAALDLNPGPASLTELAGVPAITVSTLLADRAPGAHAAHRGPTGPARGNRTRSRLDVICQDAAAAGGGAMPALQLERLVEVLASRYMLTLADPGAPAVAKLLGDAGQLVLVAPASPDAARAVSMTCEWLSGHGHAALAKRAIAVLNGVSQRSVHHAEQAELVLRGRCRAMVRVPWDDHLAEPETERGIRDSLEATDGQARLARLRPAVLQAYTALAGVLVSSLGDDPVRRRETR